MLRPLISFTSADMRAALAGKKTISVALLKEIARHAFKDELQARQNEVDGLIFENHEEDEEEGEPGELIVDELQVTL
jgi:hypothetical protein